MGMILSQRLGGLYGQCQAERPRRGIWARSSTEMRNEERTQGRGEKRETQDVYLGQPAMSRQGNGAGWPAVLDLTQRLYLVS